MNISEQWIDKKLTLTYIHDQFNKTADTILTNSPTISFS
jgi:hypothetical protein